jgi:hypothetical protein
MRSPHEKNAREERANTRAGRLRMEHLPDFSGMTYGVLAKRLLTKQAVVLSDANPSYNAIQPHVERHQPSKTDPKKAAKALPWVPRDIPFNIRLLAAMLPE